MLYTYIKSNKYIHCTKCRYTSTSTYTDYGIRPLYFSMHLAVPVSIIMMNAREMLQLLAIALYAYIYIYTAPCIQAVRKVSVKMRVAFLYHRNGS